MAEEVAEEQEEIKPAPKRGSSIGKMVLIIVLALVSSAGGGVLSWVLISRTMHVQAAGQEQQAGGKKAEYRQCNQIYNFGCANP